MAEIVCSIGRGEAATPPVGTASSAGPTAEAKPGSGERDKLRPQQIVRERMRLYVITDDKASLIFHALVIGGACCVAGLVEFLVNASSGYALTWLLLVVLAETGMSALNYFVKRANPADSELPFWAFVKTAASLVDGCILSSGAIFLHVSGELISVLAPAWAIMIAVSGTVFAAASYPACMYVMMSACIAPASIFLVLQGGSLETAVGTSMLVFLPVAFAIGSLSIRNYGLAVAARLDISNLLEQQTNLVQKMKEVSAERTRFFSAASHDLRQPLQALDFYMSLLESTVDEAARRDIISLLSQSVDSLDRQFNAILGVTEIDAVIERTRPAPMPLQVVFDRVIASVKPHADVKQLQVRCIATSLWALALSDALERVLVNLLMNAVRYTPAGSVLIGARPRARRIEVWVVDTGIGIAKQHHSRIFEDFYQVDNPERNRLKGFGLGLAIVHRFSTGMHWPLTLESEPGRGSIFKVSIPRAKPGTMAAPNTRTTSPDVSSMQELAVLFVDDDPLVRNATTRLLSSWNVTVHACSNGDEALAVLKDRDRSRRWRALLDFRLADSDNGILLAQRIRKACGDDIPIFLMTAETDEQILAEAGEKNLRVLRKPLKPINLRAALM